MKLTKQIFYLLLFFQTTFVVGQQTAIYSHELKEFDRAVELYKDKQYQSAQIIFDKVINSVSSTDVKADCAYYISNCAIRLNQTGADQLMEDFVENYPTSTKHNQAYIEVAHYYFDQSNYPQALKYFDKVDESGLTNAETEKFNFQKGYAYFTAKNLKESSNYFNKVVNSKEYGNQAKYYLGYLAYETDDYKKANDYFDKVSDQDRYKEKMGYFQADMNFKLGNFQKAIDLGLAQMSKSRGTEVSELSKIIGESYFNLKQYDKAIPYLEDYKGTRGKWNNTDYYQLGYAYYKQKDYEKAISQFNKIIGGNDAVAQNAYYHLGECFNPSSIFIYSTIININQSSS